MDVSPISTEFLFQNGQMKISEFKNNQESFDFKDELETPLQDYFSSKQERDKKMGRTGFTNPHNSKYSPLDNQHTSTFTKGFDNSQTTEEVSELMQVKILSPQILQVENKSAFDLKRKETDPSALKDIKMFDVIDEKPFEINQNSGVSFQQLLEIKPNSKVPPTKDKVRFIALKIKDYEEAVKEKQNTFRIPKSHKKVKNRNRAKTHDGSRPFRVMNQQICVPQAEKSIEDEREIWKMQTHPYQGVFAFEQTKKNEFFSNFDRFVKRADQSNKFNSSFVEQKSDSNRQSKPLVQKINHKPREMKHKAQSIVQKNEEVVAVYQGMPNSVKECIIQYHNTNNMMNQTPLSNPTFKLQLDHQNLPIDQGQQQISTVLLNTNRKSQSLNKSISPSRNHIAQVQSQTQPFIVRQRLSNQTQNSGYSDVYKLKIESLNYLGRQKNKMCII